jgi:hypothetical protein
MKSFKQFILNLSWILPPILLSISFVLSLYQQNMADLSLPILITPLLITLPVTLFFSLIAFRLIADPHKRTIFLSFFIIIIFSYSDFLFFVQSLKFISIENDINLFLPWLTLPVLFYIFIKRVKKNLVAVNKFILIASVLAVIFPLVGIAKFEITERLLKPSVSSSFKLPTPDKSLVRENLPDIYYIVPDSYGSPDVFKKYYNFDNSKFINFLTEQGFHVPANHTSNYPITFLSVSSTLNMEYLDYLSVYKNYSDISLVTPLFNDNNVLKFLKSNNYSYYQMGSWWQITSFNPQADANFVYNNRVLTRKKLFNQAVIRSTVLQPVATFITKGLILNFINDGRNFTNYQFEQLPKTTELPGPKFVFTHIIAPHTPYVFGKDCEFVIKNTYDTEHEVENYINQVECINSKLEESIKKILANSKKPPIIIIQSDEGPTFLRFRLPEENKWGDADDDLLKQKMPVFAAYYLPGVNKAEFASFSSSVNIFRFVFNKYFNTNFEMLEDKNYIFPGVNDVYNFIEVTERIK